MTKTIAFSLILASSLGLAACSKQEAHNAVNDTANVMEDVSNSADNAVNAAGNATDSLMNAASNVTDNVANKM